MTSAVDHCSLHSSLYFFFRRASAYRRRNGERKSGRADSRMTNYTAIPFKSTYSWAIYSNMLHNHVDAGSACEILCFALIFMFLRAYFCFSFLCCCLIVVAAVVVVVLVIVVLLFLLFLFLLTIFFASKALRVALWPFAICWMFNACLPIIVSDFWLEFGREKNFGWCRYCLRANPWCPRNSWILY